MAGDAVLRTLRHVWGLLDSLEVPDEPKPWSQ